MKAKEIIIKNTAANNSNLTKVMNAVKKVKGNEGTIHGINFKKILHQIVLF